MTKAQIEKIKRTMGEDFYRKVSERVESLRKKGLAPDEIRRRLVDLFFKEVTPTIGIWIKSGP